MHITVSLKIQPPLGFIVINTQANQNRQDVCTLTPLSSDTQHTIILSLHQVVYSNKL